jgi:hypothetical protein
VDGFQERVYLLCMLLLQRHHGPVCFIQPCRVGLCCSRMVGSAVDAQKNPWASAGLSCL